MSKNWIKAEHLKPCQRHIRYLWMRLFGRKPQTKKDLTVPGFERARRLRRGHRPVYSNSKPTGDGFLICTLKKMQNLLPLIKCRLNEQRKKIAQPARVQLSLSLFSTTWQIQSAEHRGRLYESVVGHRYKANTPPCSRIEKKVAGHGGLSLQPSPLIKEAALKERVFTAGSGSDMK